MSDQKIQELIDNGYDFHAMDYIREAWEIFKKNAGSFIGFFLLFIVISAFSGVIPVVGTIANYLVVAPIGMVGFYIVANLIQRQKNADFGDFFKGTQYIGQLALMSLVLIAIYALIFSPTIISLYRTGVIDWYRELMADPFGGLESTPPFTTNNFLMLGLNILPLLYFQVAYMWSPHFIVFHKKGFWESMELSRRLITRQWFSVFRLLLTWIGLFMLVGLFMALLIGVGSATSMVLGGLLVLLVRML